MSSFDATCSTKAEVSRGRGMATQLAPEGLEVAVLDVTLVAIERVLGLCRRFPLVAPDHVETGAIESEMEASDSRE